MRGSADSGSGSSGSFGGVNIDTLAHAVINGDYGNGEERKRRLGANYAAVQRCVNELLACRGRSFGKRSRGGCPCLRSGC